MIKQFAPSAATDYPSDQGYVLRNGKIELEDATDKLLEKEDEFRLL